LLGSDWVAAAEQTRYAVYAALFVLWGAAVVHSTRAHLAERAEVRARPHASNAERSPVGDAV
jgi:hypothetical protein